MSRKKHENQQTSDDEQREQTHGQDQTPDMDLHAEAEQVHNDIEQALQAAQNERDELHEKLMRTAADYQNFARRAEQNVANAREQQLMEMVRSLITVLDHVDRALAVDPEKSSAVDVLSGVSMVREEFLRTLGRFGIQRIDVEPGEPFDPNRHEAMMRQPTNEVEPNHVTAQLQPGYVLNEKTIRPAQVAVAQLADEAEQA